MNTIIYLHQLPTWSLVCGVTIRTLITGSLIAGSNGILVELLL